MRTASFKERWQTGALRHLSPRLLWDVAENYIAPPTCASGALTLTGSLSTVDRIPICEPRSARSEPKARRLQWCVG